MNILSFFRRSSQPPVPTPVAVPAKPAEPRSKATATEQALSSAPKFERDRPFLSFVRVPFVGAPADTDEVTLTLGDANTNLLVFGGTGEGKSTTVGFPALTRLNQLDIPTLILDVVKSDYANLCRRFHRTMIVGPHSDATPVNLIGGWSAEKFRDFLDAFQEKARGEVSYWGTEGVTDAVLVFRFIRGLQGKEPTLASVFAYLNDPLSFSHAVDVAWATRGVLPTQTRDSADEVMAALRSRQSGSYLFSIFHVAEALKRRKSEERTHEQYAWHSAMVLGLMRPFFEDVALRQALSAEHADGMDWQSLVYDERKFIVLDMPQGQWGSTAVFVSEILRMQYRDTIRNAQEYRDALAQREVGPKIFGRDRFTAELTDEYQQTASLQDNVWLDTSRSMGHINVLLVQSMTSLYAKLGNHEAVDTIVQNCRSVICLPTTDRRTLDYVRTLTPEPRRNLVQQRLAFPVGRQAYIYQARAAQRGGNHQVSIVETGVSRFNFMKHDAATKLMANKSLLKSRLSLVRPVVHREVRCLQPTISGRVFVVTTHSESHGYIDFQTRLGRDNFGPTAVVRMAPVRNGQPSERHLADAIARLIDEHDPCNGDIVAIVRGGGDEQQFVTFNDESSVGAIKDLRNERFCYVVTGIGHTKHVWEVDNAADHACDVPYHAGEVVSGLLTKGVEQRREIEEQRRASAAKAKADEVLDMANKVRHQVAPQAPTPTPATTPARTVEADFDLSVFITDIMGPELPKDDEAA